MIIHLPVVPYDWTPVWIWVGVTLIISLLFVLGIILYRSGKDPKSILITVCIPLIGFVVILGGILVFSDVNAEHANRVGDAQVKELGTLGFTDVDIDVDDNFVASKGGKYFKGILIEITPDREYQVTELVN